MFNGLSCRPCRVTPPQRMVREKADPRGAIVHLRSRDAPVERTPTPLAATNNHLVLIFIQIGPLDRSSSPMKSRYTFCLTLLSALLTLALAGCRGVVGSSTPPGSPMTVTMAGTGAGTVTSSPAGINCPATCSASFPQNSQVTLSETPATSDVFSGWSGACTGDATCSVTLSGVNSVTATFGTASPSYALTVTMAGMGTGTVTSTPAGITCPTICSASFAQNTQVTLNEIPRANNSFTGWSGACKGAATCSVLLTAADSVTATFGPTSPSYALTVTMAGMGTGTVTSTPAGITCPTICSASFAQNTQVTLNEIPRANNSFTGWSGACKGAATCSVLLTAADSVTATFGPTSPSYALTVTMAGLGTGTHTRTPAGITCPTICSASFAQNTQVT